MAVKEANPVDGALRLGCVGLDQNGLDDDVVDVAGPAAVEGPPHVNRRSSGPGVGPYTSWVGNADFDTWVTRVTWKVTVRSSDRRTVTRSPAVSSPSAWKIPGPVSEST